MKHFSFKIFILCILLPPVLYILTIRSLENYIQSTYTRDIENTYLGDTRRLFDGEVRLKDAVNENIDRFLNSKPLTKYGLNVKITVTTKGGTILYPAVFAQAQDALLPSNPAEIATENYKLLTEGLVINLDATLEHLTLFPNLIILIYMALSVLLLYLHFRSASLKFQNEETEKQQAVKDLIQREKQTEERLVQLNSQQERLTSEISRLKNEMIDEKTRASSNEDELIEEVDALEKELEKNMELQLKQQEEIETLKEHIQHFEKTLKKDEKLKVKAEQAAGKRFNALYKNISINSRAVGGYVDLNEELKIKAEEIIHQLNNEPEKVVIKRKVFIGKRDKKSIMEVIFGYKGRLYFQKEKDGAIEVLAIGTKNTQAREMEFLNNL